MNVRALASGMLRVRRAPLPGWCPICGRPTMFVWIDSNLREGLYCPGCDSVARHRLVAQVLLERWGKRSLRQITTMPERLYTTDAQGPLAHGLRRLRAEITTSSFVPEVPLGRALPRGGTCQNLERLTYPAESFDVVVTEDVLEHVRDPVAAFAEIHRVLAPGGVHVFTVPFMLDRPTITRVDTSGTEDRPVMEPDWHGDSIRGRILSYRAFGYDLFDRLGEWGFDTRLRLASSTDRRRGIFDCFALVSEKP